MNLEEFMAEFADMGEYDGGWRVTVSSGYQMIRTVGRCMCPIVALCHAKTGVLHQNAHVGDAARLLGLEVQARLDILGAADNTANWSVVAIDTGVEQWQRDLARRVCDTRRTMLRIAGLKPGWIESFPGGADA